MEDLEALLTDLQNTTAILKKANLSDRYSGAQEDEPIYQPQRAHVSQMAAPRRSGELQDLEQLLEDYDDRRPGAKHQESGRPTVESLLGELDNAVVVENGDRKNPVTATKDLDNLMNSLSDFKMNQDPAYANPQPRKSPKQQTPPSDSNQLDSMLGTLQNDMSKHGISTVPKGDCSACQKTIVGQVVIALGKMWHPEHFICANCGEELGHRNFFERSGRAYCENDYHNLFSPRCGYCNGAIKDKCVTALDKTWHPDHFVCAQCGNDFGEEGFHEKDGKAYCRQDYFSMFAPRCRGCQKAIMHNFITALNSQWHVDCFRCQDCKQPFNGGSFFDHDGAPYCETHYHAKRGSLCAGCQKPISGRCVTAMGRKFHPEHFCCSFCLTQLNKGTFKEHENKPYCHKCFGKLLS